MIHVPRNQHAALLRSIATWLRSGGLLATAMTFGGGVGAYAYEEEWMGAPMYWSGFDSATNRRLV